MKGCMKESKFSILFRHWIKANPRFSSSFEMKQTTTDSLPFSAVTEEQLTYGMAIKGNKGVLLRTQAVTEGMPDYVYLRNTPAYIVVKYPRFFCLIDVETFTLERDRSKRKSLTGARAKEISTVSVRCG